MKVYCENRNRFYAGETENQVVKWDQQGLFFTKEEAEEIVLDLEKHLTDHFFIKVVENDHELYQ